MALLGNGTNGINMNDFYLPVIRCCMSREENLQAAHESHNKIVAVAP
jgi:hypothetical protein